MMILTQRRKQGLGSMSFVTQVRSLVSVSNVDRSPRREHVVRLIVKKELQAALWRMA